MNTNMNIPAQIQQKKKISTWCAIFSKLTGEDDLIGGDIQIQNATDKRKRPLFVNRPTHLL